MTDKQEITFTKEEVKSIYDLIVMLSGYSAENCFAWDGTDTLEDASTSAFYKIFKICGRKVPENLEVENNGN